MHSLLEQLNWRYATKDFDPTKKLSDEQWATVSEALRLSASSYGFQPYKFVVVKNPDLRAKLLPHSYNQTKVTDASYLIVLCRLTTFDSAYVEKFIDLNAKVKNVDPATLDGFKKMLLGFVTSMTEEQKTVWMEKQVYLALGNLLTSCAVLGIDAGPMEGFIPQKYDEVLGLSAKGLHATVLCAIGMRSANDKYAQMPKVRFPKEELFITL